MITKRGGAARGQTTANCRSPVGGWRRDTVSPDRPGRLSPPAARPGVRYLPHRGAGLRDDAKPVKAPGPPGRAVAAAAAWRIPDRDRNPYAGANRGCCAEVRRLRQRDHRFSRVTPSWHPGAGVPGHHGPDPGRAGPGEPTIRQGLAYYADAGVRVHGRRGAVRGCGAGGGRRGAGAGGVPRDAVRRGRCRIDQLAEELAHAPVRQSAWLRRTLAEVADGVRSAAEGDLRSLIRAAGLPAPIFNARLYIGPDLLAVVDAWWPDAGVAVEVDSREWHLLPEDSQRTVRRSRRLSAKGIIMLHVTPHQIRTEVEKIVADIRGALESGRARPPLAIRTLPAAGLASGQAGGRRGADTPGGS